MKYVVVAYDKNRLIGKNNSLPWQNKMAADMRHFKELTNGGAVIMGRKTYDSIGHLLPNRQNIVITHKNLSIDGVDIVHSLKDAYKRANSNRSIFIIGGGQIFTEALPNVDQIIATEIDIVLSGDIYFPKISSEWCEISRQNFKADDNNLYNYSFVTYAKQR